MRKLNIFFFILLLSGLKVSAQDTLDLNKAIEIGLENNYTIRIAKNNQIIAENNNNLGNAGFLPQVNVNYNNNASITSSRAVLSGGVTKEGHNIRNKGVNGSALANWTIFDGFNMFINKHKLDELEKIGVYQARMNIEVTLSQIINTYYLAVQQEKLLQVIKEAIELSNRRLLLAKSMISIGTSSEQALLQATVDVNADSIRYLQQLNLIKITKSDLNRLMARDVTTPFETKSEIVLNKNINYGELVQNIDSQNAQILIQRANVNVAEYVVGNYKSQYLPVISLFSGYNYIQNVTPVNATQFSLSKGFTYGVTASMNLFNGGVTTTNLRNAKLQLKSSEYQYEDAKLSIHNELNKNYNNYSTSLQMIKIQSMNVATAKKDLNIAMERYKLGNINDIDLRVTQQKLIDAQNNELSAEYSAKQSEIELYRLSGQLMKVLEQ